jgi:hypothetical protein
MSLGTPYLLGTPIALGLHPGVRGGDDLVGDRPQFDVAGLRGATRNWEALSSSNS